MLVPWPERGSRSGLCKIFHLLSVHLIVARWTLCELPGPALLPTVQTGRVWVLGGRAMGLFGVDIAAWASCQSPLGVPGGQAVPGFHGRAPRTQVSCRPQTGQELCPRAQQREACVGSPVSRGPQEHAHSPGTSCLPPSPPPPCSSAPASGSSRET